MKLSGSRVDSFLRNPDPSIVAVLVYGPDRGLIKERADALLAVVTEDPRDPFRSVEFSADSLKREPTRLMDESAALSLSGGRRAVRVRDATDSVSEIFERFVDGASGGALVIVDAGELGPRSSLRKLFERAGNTVTLPCYADDEKKLDQLVHESLAARGLGIAPEAAAFLVANLGGDRAVTHRELDKLALYKGLAGTVTLEDAMAVIGDSSDTSLDAVVHAAFSGDAPALDRALEKGLAEDVQPIAVLRAAARHLQRLHMARGLMSSGKTPDQAMQALRPPVFFAVKDAFRDQLRRWDERRLSNALNLITEAELDCKTTGTPVEAVCGRTLMRLAHAARSDGGGR